MSLPKQDCSLELTGSGCEIRTHGPITVAGFQDQCNQPLCQPAKKCAISLGKP